MRVLLCALLLIAAAGSYGEYLTRRSNPKWENVDETGDSQTEFEGGGAAAVLRAEATFGSASDGNITGSGSAMMPFINLDLPVCMEDELLEFNGTELVCKKIPERKCVCPEPMSGSGDMMLQPEPPGGCTVFQPPEGGAFVCLRMADTVIYCSVVCDHEHEFSTFPVNPYFCGLPSNFKWTDFTNVTHEELPKCTGFRYTLRTLHREQFYIPNKCNSINATQINTIKKDFCCLLIGIPSRRICESIDCETDDIFIQCPT